MLKISLRVLACMRFEASALYCSHDVVTVNLVSLKLWDKTDSYRWYRFFYNIKNTKNKIIFISSEPESFPLSKQN